MIHTLGLSYSYSDSKSISFPDFRVEKGSHLLLLGQSGSGKTTLLHLLGGLLHSQQGDVMINGIALSTLSGRDLDQFRGRNFGFIFQRHHLIQALTVKQNLLMAPFLAGLDQDEDRVEEVLEQLGLSEKKNAKVFQLSQGQAQRVAIARAILNKPAVLLADEPTSALDDSNCEKVADLLREAADQNQSTLVIATHDHRLKSKFNQSLFIH
jgi:ABC-type antimicrobial peptide transport system, ATPase component